MSRYRTREFLTLKKKWDLELKKSGFLDTEEAPYKYENLINKVASEDNFNSKRDYYLMLSHKFNETTFRILFHEIIMRCYIDGQTNKQIISTLNKQGLSYSRKTIQRVVKKYLTFWLNYGS